MHRASLAAAATGAAILIGTTVPGAAAHGATSSQPAGGVVAVTAADHGQTIVSDDPIDNTPDVLGGTVAAILQVGDTVYVGGVFNEVQERGSAVVTPRLNLFAFSASTGRIDPGFQPVLTGGGVDDLVLAPDRRSMYVAGAFNKVNGSFKTRKIARITLDTGAVVRSFSSPRPDGRVTDLNLVGNTLYVGGRFTAFDGAEQHLIAALDAETGADRGTVEFTFSETFGGGTVGIRGMDVTADGSKMVVVGNFSVVDGQRRYQAAMFDLNADHGATLAPWFTFGFAGGSSNPLDSYMRDVAFSPDGSYFVIVTSGGPSGGAQWGTLADTASRWETTSSDEFGVEASWVNYTGGDTLTRVAITSSAVYVGGHQRWMNNGQGSDSAGPGAVPREGLAALAPASGQPYAWNPTRGRGHGVSEFTVTDGGLWMGHDTLRVHQELRSRLAFFPLTGGTTPPA